MRILNKLGKPAPCFTGCGGVAVMLEGLVFDDGAWIERYACESHRLFTNGAWGKNRKDYSVMHLLCGQHRIHPGSLLNLVGIRE